MKKTFLFLCSLMLTISYAWAGVSAEKLNGVPASAQITLYDLDIYDELEVEFAFLGGAFQGGSADVDMGEIFGILGCEDINELTIYAVQSDGSLDPNYKLGTTDGWRDKYGDWQEWGDYSYFCVKTDFDLQYGQICYVGTMDGKSNPNVFTAKFALVKNSGNIAVILNDCTHIIEETTINCEPGNAQDYDYTTKEQMDVLLNRNLRVDQFNTLVLPFDMNASEVEEVFGNGTEVYLFDRYNSTTNNIQMVYAQDGNPITANRPCVIVPKRAMPDSGYSITKRTLKSCDSPNPTYAGSDGSVKSIGNYSASYVVHPDGNNTKGNWIIGYKDNKPAMYYVDQDNAISLRPTQAYFSVPGAIRAKAINLSVDGDVTGIMTIDNGELNFHAGKIYDLSGREVTNPSRGIYIINGKKVMIK